VRETDTHGDMRNSYETLLRKTEKRDHLRALGVDGRIILKQILNK
jgi:hypothetical protein